MERGIITGERDNYRCGRAVRDKRNGAVFIGDSGKLERGYRGFFV
jgi:hypothetical protein